MFRECRCRWQQLLFLSLLCAAIGLAGCTNPAKAKQAHVDRGEAYLKEEKFQEAALEFRNALQIDDKFAAAHWGLARAYEGLKRLPEAFDEVKRTVDLDPAQLDSRVKLGNYYLLFNPPQVTEAASLAEYVLQQNPNHIEGHILKASVLLAQGGSREQVLAELNRALEIDPQRIDSYVSLARLYIKEGMLPEAEATFRKALGVNNGSSLAHSEFGQFLAQLKRTDEAEAELRRAVEVDPSNRSPRLLLAGFYVAQGQNDRAEKEYQALAALTPDRPEGRALLADFYAATNRLDLAQKVYQDLLVALPDYARGRYRIGEIMLQRHDLNGAQAQVEAAFKQNQYDSQAFLLRARISLERGQSKEAIKDLEEVLKQEPSSRSGLYYMADAKARSGQLDQARGFAGDLEKYYPDYVFGKLLSAQISFSANDPKNALRIGDELFTQLENAGPDADMSVQLLNEFRIKALTIRGLARLEMGDSAAARVDLNSAQTMAPNSPSSYTNLARASRRDGKLDEALGLYDRALSLDKADFDALTGIIAVLTAKKQLDQANTRLDTAIAAAQGNNAVGAQVHYLKAQVLSAQKNANGAEAEYQASLSLNADYLPAYLGYAALLAGLNRVDQAVGQYRQALNRNPDDAGTYTLLGMLEDSRGNYDAAVNNYSKALELEKNSPIASNNLAWIYAEYDKGNLDEALRLSQTAVSQFPDEPGYLDTLGWIYYKKGLFPSAAEQLQKAAELDQATAARRGVPANPDYRYRLGLALAAGGDKEGARRELEQALVIGEKTGFAQADQARKTLSTL
jgi:tetratricopeptide (TPR) repeat protein